MIIYRYKINGFTLAEVLITLLIIGVVSSIVIPALIHDTQDTEFKTAYKKALAAGSLAVKMGISEYQYTNRQAGYDLDATNNDWNTFKSYFNIVKNCSNNNNDQCWDTNGEKMESPSLRPFQREKAFIDNSGMAWSIYNINENIILADTNGFKGPNRYGKDRWQFVFKNANNARQSTGFPVKFGPYSNIDYTWKDTFFCHYPPCYFQSWLTQ